VSTDTVGDLVGSGLVEQTLAPVATAADDLTGSLVVPTLTSVPVVGDDLSTVVDGAGADILVPVAQAVDSVLGEAGEVTGSTGDVVGGILDDAGQLVPTTGGTSPQPHTNPSTLVGDRITAAAGPLAAAAPSSPLAAALAAGSRTAPDTLATGAVLDSRAAVTWNAPTAPAGPLAIDVFASSPSGTSSSGQVFAPSGGVLAADGFDPLLDSSLRGAPVDSAPPASVTYDTDSSPD
jgi:hypothetical protein